MRKLKKKIKEFLTNAWDEIEYGLKCLCGKPSPMKSFIVVLIIGGLLSIAHIYSLVNSIYNMGVREAERKFMELQHIETLKLQHKNDSINLSKQQMYEQRQFSE